jgi:Ca2+-binding EF-hand superfamily protein
MEKRSFVEWKSSDRLTDAHIQSIFAEMDEKGNGWITSREIEKRFIRFGL